MNAVITRVKEQAKARNKFKEVSQTVSQRDEVTIIMTKIEVGAGLLEVHTLLWEIVNNVQILVIEQEAGLKASASIEKHLWGLLLAVSTVRQADRVLCRLSKAWIYQKARLSSTINPCSPYSMGMSQITSSHNYNRTSTHSSQSTTLAILTWSWTSKCSLSLALHSIKFIKIKIWISIRSSKIKWCRI